MASSPSSGSGVPVSGAAPATTTVSSGYLTYLSQIFLGDLTGSTPALPNALDSTSLDQIVLSDPETIQAIRDTISGQMNSQVGKGGLKFTDLSDRIADVIIDTSAQGAGTLEVHLIDPQWVIPNFSGLIQADTNGYLLPLDINFPTTTDCWWRLCQYRPSYRPDMPTANLVLTFEDRIVSQLREISPGNGGILQGQPNQTLSGFFQELVNSTNTILKPHPQIRYVPMVDPQDPNATVQITQLPSRVKRKLALTGLTAQMNALIAQYGTTGAASLSQYLPAGTQNDLTMTEIEQILANKSAQLQSTVPWLTPSTSSLANRGTDHADPTNYAK